MKTETTWWANIYVGLYNKDTDKTHDICVLKTICEKYCDEVGFCVTFTPTTFIYTKGGEPGVIVGCIQYPRFPRPWEEIRDRVIELAKRLMVEADQYRVSIVTPEKVIMLSKEDGDV
jgi:hypothetical protein